VNIGGPQFVDWFQFHRCEHHSAAAATRARRTVKLGGNQIEYEDQFPLIAEMFDEAARENGFEIKMSKYNIPGMRKS
jgi:hypothetical protein